MPNFCECVLAIGGTRSDVAEVLAFVKGPVDSSDGGDVRVLDFNTVIPMPLELRDIQSGRCTIGEESVNNWRVVDGQNVKVDEADLIKRFGFANWYEWSRERWNTKWNALRSRMGKPTRLFRWEGGGQKPKPFREAVIEFETAWSPPEPVIEELARRFPKCQFDFRYWEGGAGYAGHQHFGGGVRMSWSHHSYSGPRGG